MVQGYAGPTSQAVTYRNAFSGRISRWHQYLASTHGIIVASLDGRGTAARGDDFKFKIYRKCGDVEIEDQIGLVKHLMGKNELKVDKTKTAIWGWSYGGFASSHALGAESNKKDGYQCAMAVAPVSNQALYDTAYSERYLGLATPDDNAYGYNVTNVLNKIHNFKDKKYFLAHGSADDNVHFFNAARLIQALTEAEIQFDFQMYIDKDHGISGTHTSPHLFTALGNFLLYRCYEYDDKPAPSPTSTPASGNYVTYSYLLSVALVLKVVIV